MASRKRWIKKFHVTRSCHARSCSQLGGCPGSLKRTVRRSISAGPDYAPTRVRHVLRGTGTPWGCHSPPQRRPIAKRSGAPGYPRGLSLIKLGAHALSRGVAVGFPPPAGLATKAIWTSPPAQRPLLIHWRTHIVAAFDVAPPIEMTTGTS